MLTYNVIYVDICWHRHTDGLTDWLTDQGIRVLEFHICYIELKRYYTSYEYQCIKDWWVAAEVQIHETFSSISVIDQKRCRDHSLSQTGPFFSSNLHCIYTTLLLIYLFSLLKWSNIHWKNTFLKMFLTLLNYLSIVLYFPSAK